MSASTLAEAALPGVVAAIRRRANDSLPPALDRRILDLGERKEELTPDEREELLAWVAFTQERSIDRLAAQVALRELADRPAS